MTPTAKHLRDLRIEQYELRREAREYEAEYRWLEANRTEYAGVSHVDAYGYSEDE